MNTTLIEDLPLKALLDNCALSGSQAVAGWGGNEAVRYAGQCGYLMAAVTALVQRRDHLASMARPVGEYVEVPYEGALLQVSVSGDADGYEVTDISVEGKSISVLVADFVAKDIERIVMEKIDASAADAILQGRPDLAAIEAIRQERAQAKLWREAA